MAGRFFDCWIPQRMALQATPNVKLGVKFFVEQGFALICFIDYGGFLAKTVGYLVTWTTYGTWLQGEKKGYVKDGRVFKKNEGLRRDNEQRLVKGAVRLCAKEKSIVETAIREEAERLGIVLHGLAVCSNHVHLVYGYSVCSIEEVVRKFKKAGKLALKDHGMMGKACKPGCRIRFIFFCCLDIIFYRNTFNEP